MKTPRDILLHRHRAANTELDSIRQSVLNTECRSEVRNSKPETRNFRTLPWRVFVTLWNELILPARRIWTGFAFIWLILAAINLAQSKGSPRMEAKSKPVSTETLLAWREQERILADLSGWTESRDAEKRKSFTPKPRSEREDRWCVV
ncbi:MAG TPA: hypothetical protein VIV82_02140 [Verrucomicrobiae bacterium]